MVRHRLAPDGRQASVGRIVAALALAAAMGGCSGGATPPGPTVAASPTPVPPPPGVTIVAELGYPRDLYERGRVNLVTSRRSRERFEVVGKRLLADHFVPADLDDHRSVIPPGGQPVALQTRFGAVADCSSERPVRARAELLYRYGDDPSVRRSLVPLADTAVLDGIRARQCTTAAVLSGSTVTFDGLDRAGEAMDVDAVITRGSGPARDLRVESVAGTVLLGAALRTPPDGPAPAQDRSEQVLTVPLALKINRCDAHAVAETTRKYGIDLWVSVDGADARPVPLPIEQLTDEFDAMLEHCRRRMGQ